MNRSVRPVEPIHEGPATRSEKKLKSECGKFHSVYTKELITKL